MKMKLCCLFLIVCCAMNFSGCDVKQTDNKAKNPNAEENTTVDKALSREEIAKMFSGNDLLEIYNDNEPLPFSCIPMIASVSPEDILKGNPILYTRFKTDGRIFELLISDYSFEDAELFYPINDGVLIITTEDEWSDELSEPQLINIGDGYPFELMTVKVQNRFEYVDVNFDNLPDLLICTGEHGNQCFITYFCFLQSADGFYEASSFTDIRNPSIDRKNKMILGQWRNWAASHSWAKYTYQDGKYKEISVLTEELITHDPHDVWSWTVDGKEISRSDRLTEKEQRTFFITKTANGDFQAKDGEPCIIKV